MIQPLYSKRILSYATLAEYFLFQTLQTSSQIIINSISQTETGLARVHNVQESVLITMLAVDGTEERTGSRQGAIDVDEEGLVVAELDALSDQSQELGNRQVTRDQVLVLVNVGDVAGGSALDNHGDLVGMVFGDFFELFDALFCMSE